MDEVKVSVIIPIYDAENTLRECLDSLLNQTLKNIEVICVDTGSTDNSLQILNEYVSKFEKMEVICEQNLSVGSARNIGLKKAKGSYLAFLNSDDFFECDMLERTFCQGEATQADVVIFGADHYHVMTDTYTKSLEWFRRDYLPEMTFFSRKDIPDKIFQVSKRNVWTKIYRRQFIVENKIEFQEFRHSSNIYFTYMVMAFAAKITFVDADLVHHRVAQKLREQNDRDVQPVLFLDAYIALYEKLLEGRIFEEVEKSFVNAIVSDAVYALNHVKTEDGCVEIYRTVTGPFFKKMGILDHQRGYYINKQELDILRGAFYVLEWRDKFDSKKKENNGFRKVLDNRKSESPGVSVIIPVYNVAQYLKQCLDSIKGQTFSDIEIICVNDGSLDYSFEVLMECAENDNRICIYRQNHSGQSSARNAGVRLARGKYVCFVDGDDALDIDALSALYDKAEKMSLDVLYFDGQCFNDSDECEENRNCYKNYYIRKHNYENVYQGKVLMCMMLGNQEYRASSCLQFINKSFFTDNNLWFLEGIIHEGELFNYKCMFNAKRVSHISRPFYWRRIYPESVTAQRESFADAYGYFRCYLEVDRFLESIKLDESSEEATCQIMQGMLHNARDHYYQLKAEEQNAYKGLPLYQRELFKLYVSDFQVLKEQISRNSIKLKRTYNEKSEINRKLQITYGEKAERGIQIKELEKEITANNELLNESEQEIIRIKNSAIFRCIAAIGWLPRKMKKLLLNR